MKKLLNMLEKHKLLAPQSEGNADTGASGSQTQASQAQEPEAQPLADTEPAADAPATQGETPQTGTEPAAQPKEKEEANTLLTQGPAGEPGEEENAADVSEGLETPQGMEYAEGELDEFKQITAALSPKDRNAILAWQAKYDAIKSGAMAQAFDQEVRAFVKRQAEENKQKVLESWGKDPAVRAKREADVARAVRQFATDDFKKLMEETGLGNHPAVVATFEAVGKAFGEDRVITGHAGAEPKDLAHRMFPQFE